MNKKAVQLRIEGRVQGVGFRYSVQSIAARLGISGWVKNEYDGSVSVFCEGDASKIDTFIRWCRKGPSYSRVSRVDIKILPYRGVYSGFTIDY